LLPASKTPSRARQPQSRDLPRADQAPRETLRGRWRISPSNSRQDRRSRASS
jgi:hypothetical protein